MLSRFFLLQLLEATSEKQRKQREREAPRSLQQEQPKRALSKDETFQVGVNGQPCFLNISIDSFSPLTS